MSQEYLTFSQQEINSLKILHNKVLAKPLIDTDRITTESGFTLLLDTSWKPENHQPALLEVVKTPKKLIYDRSLPNNKSMEWKTDMDIVPGDRVVCSYRGTLNGIKISVEGSKDVYYLIDYDQIFFVKREKIRMLNGYLLVEPIKEKVNSFLIGQQKESNKVGIVRHAGPPNHEYYHPVFYDDPFITEGHKVVFKYKYQKRAEKDLHRTMDQDYKIVQRSKIVAVIDLKRKTRRRAKL